MTEQITNSNISQNDKIMAALAHVSAIMPFMGVIAPVIIWVTQKEKSPFVAFQALQAVAFQLLMILGWFLGMGCYMLSFFSMFLTIPFAGNGEEVDPAVVPFFMLGFFTPFFVMGAMLLVGAVMIIYGLIGAIMTFQGKDFRYVLIGNRLANFLEQK